jgi:hypothetical protein
MEILAGRTKICSRLDGNLTLSGCLVRGAGSSLQVIHAVNVSAVAFNQRRASFLLGLVALPQ